MCVALGASSACETRNPYEISKQRQQGQARGPETSAPDQPATPPAADAAPAVPKLLPDATEVPRTEAAPTKSEKLDLAAARAAHTLVVSGNDPAFQPRIDALFDGSIATLARTEDVNPLVLTFEFAQPIRLAAVRLYPSYSSYDWGIEPAQGEAGQVVRNAPAEMWSGVALSKAVETRVVRVLMRRLERDNFVHVNEVELWVTPAGPRSPR